MLLVVAYGRRMAYEDWRPSPQLGLLWANTFALVLSSVALQWALFSARRGQMDGMRVAFLADRKSTRLNSSHGYISYAVFCLKKKNISVEVKTLVKPEGGEL